MALTRWPAEAPAWLLPWEIWLLRGKKGTRPSTAPATIPQFGWEFDKWTRWRRVNKPPPRPDIIETIPKWAYGVLRQVMIAVPLVEPPPPPPPANPDPPDSWHLQLPIMFTSHGFLLDSDWKNDEGIDRCVAAGIKTIALQGGMFSVLDADRCRNKGLKVAVWGSPSSRDAEYLALAGAEGYIGQVEGPGEYEALIRNLDAGVGRGMSISFVTTFSGLNTFTSRNVGTPQEHPTTVETEELAERGCTRALVECYAGDMSPMSVEQMMFTGTRWRGLYYSNPVIGLAKPDVYVSSYQPKIDEYGRQFGVYLAEPMRAIDWQAVKAL